MGFQNKTAVITGGALGIGRCLTRAFVDAGCRIAFFYCGQRAGEENLNFLQRMGKDALFFCGNGEALEALEAFVQKTINTYGNIDYLINNMCINRGGLLTPCGYEDFLAVLKVGVAAPYYLTQRFLPYFNSGGCVVNLSSTRAVQSQENTESYTAAKGGVAALTHAMAVSLAGRVRVNAIAPGYMATEMNTALLNDEGRNTEILGRIPAHRWGTPDDMKGLCIFLASDASDYIAGAVRMLDALLVTFCIAMGVGLVMTLWHQWVGGPLL